MATDFIKESVPTLNDHTCEICGRALLDGKDKKSCKTCHKVLCMCCLELQEKLLYMRNEKNLLKHGRCLACSLLLSLRDKRNSSVRKSQPISADSSKVTQKNSIFSDTSEGSDTEKTNLKVRDTSSNKGSSKVIGGSLQSTESSKVSDVSSPSTESSEITAKSETHATSKDVSSDLSSKIRSKFTCEEIDEGSGSSNKDDSGIHCQIMDTDSATNSCSSQRNSSVISNNQRSCENEISGQGQTLSGHRSKVNSIKSHMSDESNNKTGSQSQNSGSGIEDENCKDTEGNDIKDEEERKQRSVDIVEKTEQGDTSTNVHNSKSENHDQMKTDKCDSDESPDLGQRTENDESVVKNENVEKHCSIPSQKLTFTKDQFKDKSMSFDYFSQPSETKVKSQGPMMNQDEDDEDDDDEIDDVEYDNLGLKELRSYDNSLALCSSLLEGGDPGIFGFGEQSQGPKQKGHGRGRMGVKMALLTITKPVSETRGQDEKGRPIVRQRYEYRNILMVNTGNAANFSEEDSSGLSDLLQIGQDTSSESFPTDSIEDPYLDSLGTSDEVTDATKGNSAVLKDDSDKELLLRQGSQTGQSEEHLSHEADVKEETVNDTPKRSKKRNRRAFAHACTGCGRRDCEGNFMKFLREMIVTAKIAGFEIRNVIPDGNCMFAAIVDQLESKNDFSFSPRSLRQECVNFLRENPNSEDGTPYVLFLDGENWEDYLTRLSQDGEWGDHLILQAIAQVTKRSIQVIHHDAERNWTVIDSKQESSDKSDHLFLGHVGEFHYVSLRPSDIAKRMHSKDDDEDGDDTDDEYQSFTGFSTSGQNLPNLDDPSKQEMFTEEYLDPWSDVPAIHFSYVLRKFVPITTTLQSADSMVANAQVLAEEEQSAKGIQSTSSSVTLIGDTAEGLYAPYLSERERTEWDHGSEWAEITALMMPNFCIAYPKEHKDAGQMDAFIVTDNVHPGYARLLTTYPDQWVMKSKGTEGNTAMTYYLPNNHEYFRKAFDMTKEQKDYNASQNTAVVLLFRKISMAIVAPFWPAEANEWQMRQRRAGWPPKSLIDAIVSGGYHFECYPHPKSTNPDIEFRACFGVAEKLLVQEALSKDQRYCFLIFKALCSQEFMEEELISSVHLKSIFFYACEQIPSDIWLSRPGACIFYLLDSLFNCIQKKNVPDYFLPANNLIDHLDGDQHGKISQKILTLMNDPMTYLLKIGKKNGIHHAMSIMHQLNEDIDKFREHHSARTSVLESLVPISINIAKYSIQSGAYKQALEQLQEAYEERLAISTCEDALPFTAFLTQATNGLSTDRQWWFYFNVDSQLYTTLCADLSMGLQPVALEELVGKDVAQDYVGLLIPATMARYLCQFCSDMAVQLFNTYHTQKCLPFLLFNLKHYRQKRQQQQNMLAGDFSGQGFDQANTFEDDFTDENALRFYEQLYIVYTRLSQLMIFEDLLPELEDVCERLGTRYAFRKLSNVLNGMGYTERAQMAKVKCNSIPVDNDCYYNN